MAATRYLDQDPQYEDDNGAPLNGGTLTFYVTGTTTPANTYSDTGLVTANPNPITLDADGRSPVEIFLDSTVTYRSILKDSAGVTLSDKDPVSVDNATAAVAAHDVSLTAHYAATESQRGFVELASDSEAQTGTATNRVLTPANLQAVTATTTRKGVVELATNAEAITGTDTTRSVTPAGLSAAITDAAGVNTTASDFATAISTTSLLFKIPGSTVLKVQGGITGVYTGEFSTDSVSFTENFAAVPHVYVSAYEATAQSPIVSVASVTTSGFSFNIIDRDTSGADFTTKVSWLAIGQNV